MSLPTQQKPSGAEAKAGNEVNRMIEALLKSKSLPLQADDFDMRAKQVLHAISHKGGSEQVAVALNMVGAFAEKKSRQGVQNWSAYVGAILRRFLNDFKVQMNSGAARDVDDDRVNSWEFKSPSSNVVLQPSNAASPEATEKKSWKDATSPVGPSEAHPWRQDRHQSPKETLQDQNAWWKDLVGAPQPEPYIVPARVQQGWQPSLAEAAHNMPKNSERWSDAHDSADAWYSDQWSSNEKWSHSGYPAEGASMQNGWGSHWVAEGSPRSRRKSVSDQSKSETMTSRRASFGGFPEASAPIGSSNWDTHDGSRSRRKSVSNKSASEKTTSRRASFGGLPDTQADAHGSPKRKPRMSLQSPKAQTEFESPKRKPRMSLAGASPSTAKNEDMERKPRKSLNGAKQWIPKAVPTLASMLQPKLTQKYLERQLALWVKQSGHSASDARIIALCDSEGSGRQLASVMLRGNECLVELDAPAGSTKHIVVGAWTRSAWPEFKNSISSAVQACAEQSFNEFIGALWQALPVPEQAVEGGQAVQSCQAECPASFCQDAFNQDAAQRTVAMDQFDDSPDQSCAREFALWLNDRQPLLRISPGDSIIAWDFPLSRAEKKEYLFLTTSAECNELREENSDLKASEAALLNEIEFCSQEKDMHQESSQSASLITAN